MTTPDLTEHALVGTDDDPGILDRYEVSALPAATGSPLVIWLCQRPHGVNDTPHVGIIARNLEGSQKGLTLGEMAEGALRHEREEHGLDAPEVVV